MPNDQASPDLNGLVLPGDRRRPSLSVIIPCYNGVRFVCDAVRSVLDQADDSVECLVVDDGSTDDSGDAIKTAFGPRVRIIRQRNSGVATARNRGLSEAAGELIIWLDADDLLAPGTLAGRQKAFVDDPALDMLVGQNKIVDLDTGAEEVSPQRCDRGYLVQDLLARTNLPHSNILTFRRSAVQRLGGYDAGFRNVDDFDLWLRAWAQLEWRFVREVQSIQRVGTFPSLSRSQSKIAVYDQVGQALRKNRELMRQTTGDDTAWRLGYSRFAADFALVHLLGGQRADARRWAWRSIARAPIRGEKRAHKYLLESSLPVGLFRLGRSALIHSRLIGRPRPTA
jgi:glycosyltransferase involved in cell wall biosynthesis